MSFLSHATLNQQTHHTPDAKTKTQLTKHDQPCSEPRQSTASVAHFHTTPRRRRCAWQDRLRFHSLFTLHLKIIPLQSYWLAAAVTDLVCVCVFFARSQPTTLTLLHKHAAAAAVRTFLVNIVTNFHHLPSFPPPGTHLSVGRPKPRPNI